MRGSVSPIAVLLAVLSSASALYSQGGDQTLGELARRERERRQAQAEQGDAGRTAVANEAVGVRLLIPQNWKAREILDPTSPHLLIDCVPAHPNSCWLMVKSTVLPSAKSEITDADRGLWDARKHPRYAIRTHRVSSRDLQVAGYPAHEVIVQNENPPRERTRTVYVLDQGVGRLFEFSFSAAWQSQDHFAQYERAIDAAIQSFSPLARAAAELDEQAIPASLKVSARTPQKGREGRAFQLQSPAFKAEGDIPEKFACEGRDVSPALSWSNPPQGAQSFALIADDPDAPAGTWVHWVVYDLPSSLRQLPEDLPKQEAIEGGGRQGQNDFRKIGYGGPCPPPGKPHRYFFKLYALDAKLSLMKSHATKHDVERAMKGHILGEAELVGRYGR
jgi:Raf kinase inhibitor-like YbhB/YbcL family protein